MDGDTEASKRRVARSVKSSKALMPLGTQGWKPARLLVLSGNKTHWSGEEDILYQSASPVPMGSPEGLSGQFILR
jgi:hypothetical protein